MEMEYTTQNDEFFDYCLYKYAPVASPSDKLRSVNLLTNFFEFMDYDGVFYDIIAAIREKIGFNKTVWGIKKMGDSFACELYFYNWYKKDPNVSISKFLEAVRPFFKCGITPDENLGYHMFSVDLLPECIQTKNLLQVHMYVGYCGYLVDETGVRLENHYSFHPVKTQMEILTLLIKKSAFVDFTKIDLDRILIPEFINCNKICRAHKPKSDGIYFSRIDIEQFLLFLNKFDYPRHLISFVEQNRPKLDHMLYDVGFDYTSEQGKLLITKSGYYGTF